MSAKKSNAEKIINSIRNKYPLLQDEDDKKYERFKDYDPFAGEITESLLNGNDVAKYALVTGMLSPFNIDQLSEVTYSARFSGNMYYYDPGSNDINKKSPNEEGYYEISQNSITYLEIDTMFRVPNYMVLRFNLRVKNVYKGLLLGTGPIIDPGFVGKIFIPLHNLTSNTYWIKKGAKLIEIEFTKISKYPNCNPEPNPDLMDEDMISSIKAMDFSTINSIKRESVEGRRVFDDYITSSLIGDDSFRTKDKNGFVCNSISTALDEINQYKKSLEGIHEDVNNQLKEVKTDQYNFKKQTERDIAKGQKKISDAIKENEQHESFMRSFSVIALISMLLTAIGLGVSAAAYFNESTNLKLQYSNVQESVYNTNTQADSRVQDIIQALDTIGQNTSFPDSAVEKEYYDTINKLKDDIHTDPYNFDNKVPPFFDFKDFILCVLATVLALVIVSLIVMFKKCIGIINKLKSEVEDLKCTDQYQTDSSEDNSNDRSN